MNPPDSVLALIQRFDRNLDDYRSGRYNEAQLRLEFVNPLFEALGWDVHNRQGWAEAYKEVIHEDAVRIGGTIKAPDYSFRVGGVRKFFVETKKPSVDIKDEIPPAFQLRRYAWSAKLPLSILTDFEEFAVYDTRIKPVKTDRASQARTLYLRYTEYAGRWEEIAGIFSKQAILDGSFDKYADSNKKKRGTADVDDAFLEDIEGWRELLARNLALRNPALTQRQLNFAVQRILDRIIFLRIAEDRGIEEYGRLQALLNGGRVYVRLQELFARADERYNSGLFHFRHERGRGEAPDELTPSLTVDDKPLKQILSSLYYPESPYEFSVLPADILGQVYERFLGKVIRLTAGHRAVVEEKPEVRKAGGVYYTPTYIVDYIVRNTVGTLVEGLKPGPRGGVSKLRILDPACGSGSFLLGAYQFLLDWHLERYAEEPERWRDVLVEGPLGGWRLSTAERKRILVNNIYGVDIDPQAVEVTKLSLLLKVLEGENEQTLERQMALFHQRALPDLADNIKSGNSLIGPDFYDGKQLGLLDEEERWRVNAFDWNAEFPEIMQVGGFDAVIGNPPYIRIQTLRGWAPLDVDYYNQHYQSAGRGNYDIYVVFVERGLELLSERGALGFILPHKFFNARYGESLRERIARGSHLEKVVHFGHQQVFAGATTYTALLFLTNTGKSEFQFAEVEDLAEWRATGQQRVGIISATRATAADWNFVVGPSRELFIRLQSMRERLGGIAERIAQGIRTSANNVYVLDLVSEDGDLLTAYSKQLDTNVRVERGAVSLFLQGREIKPYRVLASGKVLIVPYRMRSGKAELIPENRLAEQFPAAHAYLCANKEVLTARERGRFKGADWYQYGRQQNIDLILLPKILVPDIADRASFAPDSSGNYAFTSGYGITLRSEVLEASAYVLGLLNSKVLDIYLKHVSTTLRGGFFRYFTQYVEQLPIRRIDFSDPADTARHDRMVSLVEQMLALHEQLAAAKTAQDRTLLKRRIDATDAQIDRLVYDLYELTDEEIAIVESGAT